MKQRFRLYRRNKHVKRGAAVFYLEDTQTKMRTSLKTSDRVAAERLLHAHREAHEQSFKNVQIARVYLQAADPAMMTRTWQDVMAVIVEQQSGETKRRWDCAAKNKDYDLIRKMPILETRAEHLLEVLKSGKFSTNIYLRRVQNFAVDMGWLPVPILPKRRFPRYQHKIKRAVTPDEHKKIIEREKNPERRALYELAWHTGASQSDLANLHAEDIDWKNRIVTYERMKLKGRTKILPIIPLKVKRARAQEWTAPPSWCAHDFATLDTGLAIRAALDAVADDLLSKARAKDRAEAMAQIGSLQSGLTFAIARNEHGKYAVSQVDTTPLTKSVSNSFAVPFTPRVFSRCTPAELDRRSNFTSSAVVFEHGGKAAEFFADGFRFAHERA
jgi:hypothetical protein